MHAWGEVGDNAGSGKLKYEKKLVSKPLNENLGNNAVQIRDGHKNRMKHLLNTWGTKKSTYLS
jgi:hypothetical protein